MNWHPLQSQSKHLGVLDELVPHSNTSFTVLSMSNLIELLFTFSTQTNLLVCALEMANQYAAYWRDLDFLSQKLEIIFNYFPNRPLKRARLHCL